MPFYFPYRSVISNCCAFWDITCTSILNKINIVNLYKQMPRDKSLPSITGHCTTRDRALDSLVPDYRERITVTMTGHRNSAVDISPTD